MMFQAIFVTFISIASLFVSPLLGMSESFNKQNDDTETLADFLFRYSILKRSDDFTSVSINEASVAENSLQLEQIFAMLQAHGTTSPLLVKVHYKNEYKTEIASLTWPTLSTNNPTSDLTLHSYLLSSAQEIKQHLANGYQPVSVQFSEAQQENFIEHTTLANENLHLCGVTKDYERLIVSNIIDQLQQNNLTPLRMYFFGSRVMPRSEVIKRDTNFALTLPIKDDGVMKNSVRIRGLTEISDLEVLILFSAASHPSYDELKNISYEFKTTFAKQFRIFPVSIKLIQRNNDDVLDEFSLIDFYYKNKRAKALSHHQFVEIPLCNYLSTTVIQ